MKKQTTKSTISKNGSQPPRRSTPAKKRYSAEERARIEISKKVVKAIAEYKEKHPEAFADL